MFPLKIAKLFTNQNENVPYQNRREQVVASPTNLATPGWPDIERRSGLDRRHQERRAQQQAIMLDTRKAQGRRRCAGRRQSDQPALRYSLTVKG